MTPHQAIAEYVPWLPGSVADKAARLGVHKSTLFAWLAEAEGRAPAPKEGRAGRKRHREPTWADVLTLALLLRHHADDVAAFAVTAERLANTRLDAARVAALIATIEGDRRELLEQGAQPGDSGLALVDRELAPPAPEKPPEGWAARLNEVLRGMERIYDVRALVAIEDIDE